ncbi:dihydroneopterin triphosphate diphosphatase [Iodobacter fluviatilis]|jgi:dATP pyrophosphohydrolase|uniref:Dihydroneopterin triphosphate diphosphatase n=1 Tax=Iodobacter fluviatilis TaxID=537 RepID=A0A7G3GCM5_9NEIS|nr:dihydroneopterin triphosphate diphosphatase [Iodobacter fluviatilis]QBC44904.1 dihydroneopterin triphosphate diphosphatase [Iodobacter fluviatilis]
MTTSFSAAPPYKQAVSALIVIHTPDLQVLLLERTDFNEAWQSVTGSREGEELLGQTARREVFEETGIDTQLYKLRDWQQSHDFEIFEIWRHRYAPGTTHNTEHVFSLEVPFTLDIALATSEHRRFKWVGWIQAAEMVFSPSNADAIRSLPERCGH